VALTDTQIRANLRTVLTRHGIDPNKTSFVCARGIVRLLGDLEHQGKHSAKPVDAGEVEAIEQELQRVRGVKRVHMDLRSWRRRDDGWEHTGRTRSVTRGLAAPRSSGATATHELF